MPVEHNKHLKKQIDSKDEDPRKNVLESTRTDKCGETAKSDLHYFGVMMVQIMVVCFWTKYGCDSLFFILN